MLEVFVSCKAGRSSHFFSNLPRPLFFFFSGRFQTMFSNRNQNNSALMQQMQQQWEQQREQAEQRRRQMQAAAAAAAARQGVREGGGGGSDGGGRKNSVQDDEGEEEEAEASVEVFSNYGASSLHRYCARMGIPVRGRVHPGDISEAASLR